MQEGCVKFQLILDTNLTGEQADRIVEEVDCDAND